MWMWNLCVVLCVSNVIVCQHRSSNYEDPWEQLGYGFSMNPSGFQPTVYRNRIPRQVYYYVPSEEDQSLISKERTARSNYFNDPSLIAQEIIGRKSSFIDYQLQNSDEESELPPLNEAVLRSIKNRSQKRRELRSLAKNDVEVELLNMDPLQLKEALIIGLRSLAKRQVEQYPFVSGLSNEDVSIELSKEALYTNDDHENKVQERIERKKDQRGSELIEEANTQNDEEYIKKIRRISKNNYHKGRSIQQPSNSNNRRVKNYGSKEIYEDPVQSGVIHENNKLIEDTLIDEISYVGYSNPDLRRNVRSKHHVSDTFPIGHKLEASFITPDKNAINSIIYQNIEKNKQQSSTTNNDDVIIFNNQPYPLEYQQLLDTQAKLSPSEVSPFMEKVIEDYLMESEHIANDDSTIQNTSEISSQEEALSDSNNDSNESQESNDAKNTKNSKEDENQKDKKEHSNETKDLETKDKEDNKLNNSEENSSPESDSDENDLNTYEVAKPMKMKSIPPCPESMDPSFRVDENKGITCGSDDDCSGEGEYCCQAFASLNKCWFKSLLR